jgi:hypothetical protein
MRRIYSQDTALVYKSGLPAMYHNSHRPPLSQIAIPRYHLHFSPYNTSIMSSSEGKVIILTGCSNGIGLATTLLLLSRKCHVFGIDFAPFTHELDASQQNNFAFHQIDLKTPNAAEESVKACLEKFGPKIDGLANIAGR